MLFQLQLFVKLLFSSISFSVCVKKYGLYSVFDWLHPKYFFFLQENIGSSLTQHFSKQISVQSNITNRFFVFICFKKIIYRFTVKILGGTNKQISSHWRKQYYQFSINNILYTLPVLMNMLRSMTLSVALQNYSCTADFFLSHTLNCLVINFP